MTGKGLGGDDVGHHLFVQGVDDCPVHAPGDGHGHGHEGLVHELSGQQTLADVAQPAGRVNARKGRKDLLDGVDELHPEIVFHLNIIFEHLATSVSVIFMRSTAVWDKPASLMHRVTTFISVPAMIGMSLSK